MKYIDYLKDNIISIVIYLITILLIFLMLNVFKLDISVNILTTVILLLCGISIITINFHRKNIFYKSYLGSLNKLSKKYLILETIPEPNTYEERIMVDSLYEINKSMIENINDYQRNITEFKEFVEIWIHEVKIPISSMVLKCHNNKEKYDKSLLSIIRRLDNNIDEILYYVRSENTEKDFAINEVNLKEVIRNVSIKNKDDLLDNKIAFESNVKNSLVHTDKKWLEFIINQIINNSIKYKSDDSVIKISSKEDNEKTVLEIYDNGIGIPSKDINRVFDKSFTGSNGRDKVKSTGMGLYIIKRLCDKLGHNIYIESEEKKYTKVIIEFGKNDLYKI
jgi:signal transduction histidine kinase